MAVQNHKQLEVWQIAMDLAEQSYRITRSFPREELFGLTSQIRRAAVSVPANIAEGQGRANTKEFLHFLSIARGSLMELETHFLLGHRVGLLVDDELQVVLGLVDRISRMLTRLRQSLEQRSKRL